VLLLETFWATNSRTEKMKAMDIMDITDIMEANMAEVVGVVVENGNWLIPHLIGISLLSEYFCDYSGCNDLCLPSGELD
jgi:hypothetical protein